MRETAGSGRFGQDIHTARSMFDVAQMVGNKLREVSARDGSHVQAFGDPNGSFLFGGQIAGESPRLFMASDASIVDN